jgi:tRNA pseudouridine55 synthase
MAAPGILLLDKPSGPTSHDLVGSTRRALGTRKVGHAGTLDPMATGLLLLGVESATRLLTYLVGLDKEYLATIRLGEATDTDDAEGRTVSSADASSLDRARIDDEVAALTGDLDQVPSTFSAIQVDGRRSYDRARAGEAVELAPRRIRVSDFAVLAVRRPGSETPDGVIDLDVRVVVSSGTYVRALARDLGAALGVGGHLTALRRTRVGPFTVADAVPPDHPDLASAVRPAADIATALFPAVRLDPAALADLVHGRRVALDVADAPVVAALTPDGRLAGLVVVTAGTARVLINLPTSEVLP